MNEQLLPERLKIARKKLGITKAEAARKLRLSKIGYCRYEYGERTPSVQTLEVIARCFNTSVDFLSGATDNMQPDYIVISQKSEPVIFELVSSLLDVDSRYAERLLIYYKELTSTKSSQKCTN